MPRRFFCVLTCASLVVLADCGREPAARPGWGQLVLERAAPQPAVLRTLPAHAWYCARDTMLSIVGADDAWSAALALRSAWPGERHFRVAPTAAEVGTAAVAARPLRDSVGMALLASSGTVDLDTGAALTGRFSVEAGTDSARVTLTGRFEGMTPDTAGCASVR